MAFTATRQTDEAYSWLFRFVVTPLFLLSGTFFPVEELPRWGQVVAQGTPLYHGVELVRQLSIYHLDISALWHLAYLIALLGVGVIVGIRKLTERLMP
jgi:lipooligosaccharide transport system permease protein